MLPRRRLSEIVTLAKINRNVCNIIVEGPADKVVISEFTQIDRLPAQIYPENAVEFDTFTPGVEDGAKGRLISAARYLERNKIRRAFCVIDRDYMNFTSFDYNKNCMITDLSCVEIYPLDFDRAFKFFKNAFHGDMTIENFLNISLVSREASLVHWLRHKDIPDAKLADIRKSLSVRDSIISLDMSDWLQRSSGSGGNRTDWGNLGTNVQVEILKNVSDARQQINFHVFETLAMHWLRSVAKINFPDGTIERVIRGLADHTYLSCYKFFIHLRLKVVEEIAAP